MVTACAPATPGVRLAIATPVMDHGGVPTLVRTLATRSGTEADLIPLQTPQGLRLLAAGDLDGAIVKYHAEKVKEREEKEKEDHIEYQKKTKESQRELRKSLENLDKDIAELNCDVNIQINKIYLGLVNDRDDRITPGQTLVEAGLSD